MKFAVFLSFFSITSLLLILLGESIQNSYYKKILEQKIFQIQLQCNMIANQILEEKFLIQDQNSRLNIEVDQLANILDGRVMVVDHNMKVVKDSYGLDQNKYFVVDRAIRMVEHGEEARYELVDGQYLELMTPIIDGENENKTEGLVIASVSIKDVNEMIVALKEKSKYLYMFCFILVIATSWGLGEVLTKRLRVFTEALNHMADGHLDEKIPVKGYIEVQKMAMVVNDIISKMQAVENSRQEFVSNVSHELKTPITSMKVLADSLLSQEGVSAELYREFMVDIADEIERENKIINDLLALVKMDKKVSALNIVSMNINEMLEILLKRLRPLAAKRNIEMVFESFRPVIAEVDEVKLSLAFSNLVENAIKYNVDNGWIRVSLNSDHKYFYVKIVDSGIGIPEECQEQIFERFYRVDKARSRGTGGTGLGLSITRNAILMHKGAIKLYSSEGEGTTFTVRIPLNYIP